MGTLRFFYLFTLDASGSAKQQGDAPKTRKTHKGINDAAHNAALTAEQPGYQVKLKNTYQAPVQTADDRQQQCQCVHVFTSIVYWEHLQNSRGYENYALQNRDSFAIIKKIILEEQR